MQLTKIAECGALTIQPVRSAVKLKTGKHVVLFISGITQLETEWKNTFYSQVTIEIFVVRNDR